MTFKDLQKLITHSSQSNPEHIRLLLLDRLSGDGKPFWIWNVDEHKQEDIRTNGCCCFNHIIGLLMKGRTEKPLFDYEKIIFDYVVTQKSKFNPHSFF